MKMHVVLGRPCSGKTTRLIEELNIADRPSLFLSLETPEALLRKMGLQDQVNVEAEVPTNLLSNGTGFSAKVVGLDSLELLDQAISLSEFSAMLKAAGVERFIVASHLRRDSRCASEDRLLTVVHTSETLTPRGVK